MKRVLAATVGIGLAVVLLFAVAEATQNRHDTDRHDGTSTVVMHVSTKRGFAYEAAAHSLWAACQTTVLSNRLASLTALPEPGIVVLTVEPALGEHAQRRLVGCLEDATVDLVSAQVHSVVHSD